MARARMRAALFSISRSASYSPHAAAEAPHGDFRVAAWEGRNLSAAGPPRAAAAPGKWVYRWNRWANVIAHNGPRGAATAAINISVVIVMKPSNRISVQSKNYV